MDGLAPARRRSSIVPALLLLAAGALVIACSASSGQRTTTGTTGTGGGGSTHTTSGTGGAKGDDCTALCATEVMACPKTQPAACVGACEIAKGAVSWCTATATAATDCLAKQPASSFQCDMNGQPAPGAGVCASETAAAQSCWYKGPPGGLPDLTKACASFCKYESSLSCADPNCPTDCMAGLVAPDAGPVCNGALAAVIACASSKPPSDFQCGTTNPPLPELKQGVCPFEVGLLAACAAQK